MDQLHLIGVDLIQQLQHSFKGYEATMGFLSHVGDPRNAFLVFFPLVIFTNGMAGVQVMWVAALAEWLNALLKWMLHGERPYWWVQETSLYADDARPSLMQYSLTCETGPGSPSGHVMVTASVLFMITSSTHLRQMLKNLGCNTSAVSVGVNCCLVLPLLFLASMSRCFIAAHFPHQVAAGLIAGYVLARACDHLPVEALSLKVYLVSSTVLLLSAPVVYWFIELLGFDPLWSISLATKWCAESHWVYLDTTLFFAIVRDSASLLGLGLALAARRETPQNLLELHSTRSKLLCLSVSLLVTRGQEYIRIPHNNPWLFYVLAYLKYASLPVIVLVLIPAVISTLGFSTKQRSKHHNS